MENKIREYVDRKFAIYPNTEKMIEFRETIIAMMQDKYRDCQHRGMSAQKSYVNAISVLKNYSNEKKRFEAKVTRDRQVGIDCAICLGA